MDRPSVRTATLADAEYLAHRLRPEDAREVRALSGLTPIQDLQAAVLEGTESYTIVHPQGFPVGMFGVNAAPPFGDLPVGIIWLLATPRLFDFTLHFLRESKLWLEALHEAYPVLTNVIDSRNASHVRWIKWLGFSLCEQHHCGVDKSVPFYRFIRVSIKPCVIPSAPSPLPA